MQSCCIWWTWSKVFYENVYQYLYEKYVNWPKYNFSLEKYVNVAKRFHYVEDKIKRRDIDRLNTEKNLLSTLEKLQSNLKEKEDKINHLEEALTNCEIARLTSEEKILDYLRYAY